MKWSITLVESENIKICKEQKKIVITIDKTKIITRLMQGQFPKYNQLIPQTFPKEAVINKNNLISALERVLRYPSISSFTLSARVLSVVTSIALASSSCSA